MAAWTRLSLKNYCSPINSIKYKNVVVGIVYSVVESYFIVPRLPEESETWCETRCGHEDKQCNIEGGIMI